MTLWRDLADGLFNGGARCADDLAATRAPRGDEASARRHRSAERVNAHLRKALLDLGDAQGRIDRAVCA